MGQKSQEHNHISKFCDSFFIIGKAQRHPYSMFDVGRSMFDVGRSMFDVQFFYWPRQA